MTIKKQVRPLYTPHHKQIYKRHQHSHRNRHNDVIIHPIASVFSQVHQCKHHSKRSITDDKLTTVDTHGNKHRLINIRLETQRCNAHEKCQHQYVIECIRYQDNTELS